MIHKRKITNCHGCKGLLKMGHEEPCASCIDYSNHSLGDTEA